MSFIGNIVIGVGVFIAAIVFARLLRRGGAARQVNSDYRLRKDALFSRGELAFLSVLEQSLPRGVRLFGKVRLGDIFTLSNEVADADRMRARGRINQKHVDFLLVRADDLSPLAGVELDDSSHDSADRQARDAFVDTVFAGGGLPLIHFPAQHTYVRSDIRAKLEAALRA